MDKESKLKWWVNIFDVKFNFFQKKIVQKEEDLSNEVSSPSLACKPDRVETPKTESDTYEICSDCNCNTGDLEQKTEHHQEELLQIKKEPATSLQEYEAVSECSNKTFKQMDKSVDLNEEEIKKQFAYKRIYNEKGW